MNFNSYFWIAVIIVTAVIEGITAGLVTIWFSIGAVFSLAVSFFTDSIAIQTAVFFIVSILTLIITRPLVKNKLVTKKEKTNADIVIGKEGTVIQDINTLEGTGQVKVDGKIWSAKSDDVIQQGSTVTVLDIQGVKLLVK